ncbi:5,6-dimethylbenzimidazole synthase [Atopomonas sediminilitoris]|uniref:5,6-dimethylbenzimidazole synthase n=1 Tax=Atopomonas sediminilitoris TaxID=2919919 RepID=UPI001F4E0AB2|nr:5,6-dimethylbenzimidazole synthase [Atopomonas sediminilitoris]
MNEHAFSTAERAAVYRAIAERRDMRHFCPNSQVAPEVLQRLLQAAHQAPSVGLMQPWRFIRITDNALRTQIAALVEAERQRTAEALGPRKAQFLQLKVEGIRDCAELLVVALCEAREQYIFGRRTLPQMDLASAACAIQNLWLAARAEGLGLGWVSLFEPAELGALLNIPADAEAIAIVCLGPVDAFYAQPMLIEQGWSSAQPLSDLMAENRWPSSKA